MFAPEKHKGTSLLAITSIYKSLQSHSLFRVSLEIGVQLITLTVKGPRSFKIDLVKKFRCFQEGKKLTSFFRLFLVIETEIVLNLDNF